jgi:hypothetical protein
MAEDNHIFRKNGSEIFRPTSRSSEPFVKTDKISLLAPATSALRAARRQHNSNKPPSRDGLPRATNSPRDSPSPAFGVAVGESTRVTFRRPVPIYNPKSSKRYLTTIALVLLFAIIGSLGAVLLRTAKVAEASAAIVDLRRSLP